MTKGKYQRQRERAEQKNEQSDPSLAFEQTERSDTLNTQHADSAKGNPRDPKRPLWERFSYFMKQPHVTSISIAVFTGVLAAVSIIQGCFIRGQLEISEKSARPYIVAAMVGNNRWADADQTDVQVTIHGINSTGFPATNVIFSKTRVEFGQDAMSKAEACELDYASKSPVIIPPVGAGYQQNELANATAHSNELTAVEKKRLLDGIDQLVVFGSIKYSGVSHEDFETRYCWVYLPGSGYPTGPCARSICQAMR